MDVVLILITLIAGDKDKRADARGSLNRIEDVNRASNIRIKRQLGLIVGKSHQWLGCEVEHNFWLKLLHDIFQERLVKDIPIDVLNVLLQANHVVMILRALWRQSVASYLSPEPTGP
jgi:hypothetical protein